MIKENEIRIGNWFQHNANWSYRSKPEPERFAFQWNDRDWYSVGECTMSLENLDPIPISPEILLASGFKRDRNTYEHANLELIVANKMIVRGAVLVDEIILVPNKKYCLSITSVHHLQNLYFAMTGEELKIEL